MFRVTPLGKLALNREACGGGTIFCIAWVITLRRSISLRAHNATGGSSREASKQNHFRLTHLKGTTMTDDHHRRLERMYLSAPFNELYQPTIDISEGSAEIRFDVGPHLHHAARAVHGANYFKAMDDAAFFAANSLVSDVFLVTVSFNVYFLRPISEGSLLGRGTVVNASRNLWVAEATLEDDRGRLLGRGSGSFMRSTTSLVDAMGYGDPD